MVHSVSCLSCFVWFLSGYSVTVCPGRGVPVPPRVRCRSAPGAVWQCAPGVVWQCALVSLFSAREGVLGCLMCAWPVLTCVSCEPVSQQRSRFGTFRLKGPSKAQMDKRNLSQGDAPEC